MKKFLLRMFTLLFIFLTTLSTITVTDTKAMPVLEAQGVVLMDAKSGEVLFSQNPDVQYEPASITKVMTALLVLEKTNLADKVTIGANPPLVDGSALGIREGETYTVEELLLALLLESSNDCAEALAEFVAGSNAEFGKLMTERAKELGAKNTIFKNPSGLHEEGHLTTAYDMALIMKAALSNDDLIRISRVISHKYENHPFSDGTEKWATNRNNCYVDWSPYYYENLYSGKTGWTPEANHTYISAAIKNDQTLIATFLNAVNKDTQYTSVGQLFDWGFNNFNTTKIVTKGDELGEYPLSENVSIPLLSTKDIYYTFTAGQDTNIKKTISYADKDLSRSTISKGDVLFNATLLINDKEYCNVNVESGIDREYTIQMDVEQKIDSLFSNKLFISFLIILALIICYWIFNKFKFAKKRRKIRRKFKF